MRKLRRLPEPAMLRIKHAKSRFLNRRDDASRNPPTASRKRLRLRDRTLDHLRLFHPVAMFLLVGIGDAGQHALEAGPPVAIRRRKISASIKRLTIRSKKGRKRPSTLAADRADRSLVADVDV